MVVLQIVARRRNVSPRTENVGAILPNIPADYSMWIDNQNETNKSEWQDGNPLRKLVSHIFRFLRPAEQRQRPDVAQLLLSQMKDFFCLLGESIHISWSSFNSIQFNGIDYCSAVHVRRSQFIWVPLSHLRDD